MRVRREFKRHRQHQQAMVLRTPHGARLLGYYNQAGAEKSKQLVILIHGWEGSHESSYMLSMTNSLLGEGIDVFRFNMRDHGDSHHLNGEVFNSTLLEDVVQGVANLQKRLSYTSYVLAGFSLGGNFSCRVAATCHDSNLSLSKVVAFCPVLHAGASNAALSEPRNKLYSYYFTQKWKRSLRKKLEYFPEHSYADKLSELHSLDAMNQTLIPEHTAYQDVEEYFSAYAITGDLMSETLCPVYLHFSKDDMIIPYQNIDDLAENDQLNVVITDFGGHCGFLSNWRFDSWQDIRLLELLDA